MPPKKKGFSEPEILSTSDGSHTLFVKELREPYHSVNGAITESRHVFIKNGLLYRNKPEVIVFEVGFGTGLNCLLTAIHARENHMKVRYIAVDNYPLADTLIHRLNYLSFVGDEYKDLWEKIHSVAWNSETPVSGSFSLRKCKTDLTEYLFSEELPLLDVVYFDAFSPDIQPEMWQSGIFDHIFGRCREGAVLTTYSAKGAVRRKWISSGFTVHTLLGPPGKREMLRGIKPADIITNQKIHLSSQHESAGSGLS
jgi:tRNA U34 5-methylaminomethyl-2-thiouridine-forming methyltransferase MnmC